MRLHLAKHHFPQVALTLRRFENVWLNGKGHLHWFLKSASIFIADMPLKTFIFTLAVSLFAFVATAEGAHKLIFEFRAPKALKTDPLTSFDLMTEEGASGTRLRFTTRREDGEFNVFQHSCLVFSEQRRAMVVRTEGQPSQVFVLSIPRRPKPTDWGQWQRPTYVAKGHAGWDFMHDQNYQNRSTNVPPSSFELRYKIETSKGP